MKDIKQKRFNKNATPRNHDEDRPPRNRMADHTFRGGVVSQYFYYKNKKV